MMRHSKLDVATIESHTQFLEKPQDKQNTSDNYLPKLPKIMSTVLASQLQ